MSNRYLTIKVELDDEQIQELKKEIDDKFKEIKLEIYNYSPELYRKLMEEDYED